ncbi:hypothetical protein [Mycobacteroides abscessus]|uniref:hypothetical protein n=1 Tax=Mycobacteroides abscessus TaxID=36809 RepID=UPI000C25CC67|nr:hypothetical protein [Mycobacteroides abscessus]
MAVIKPTLAGVYDLPRFDLAAVIEQHTIPAGVFSDDELVNIGQVAEAVEAYAKALKGLK